MIASIAVLAALLACSALLPLRWALLAVLVGGNFDLSGAEFASGTTFGTANALRTLLPPLVLIWRLGPPRVADGLLDPLPVQAFVAWVAFAAVSVLWSPLPLAGIKLIGFLATWLVLFALMRRAWLDRLLDGRLVAWMALVALASAVAQSWVFGNPYGTDENRFTSWTSPQSFAQFLVGTGFLLACLPAEGALKPVTLLLIVAALPFTGSRSAMLGAAAGVCVLVVLRFAQRGIDARERSILALGLVAALVGAGVLAMRSDSPAVVRLAESFAGEGGVGGVRTVRWRYAIWDAVGERLSASEPAQALVGRGAASGGELLVTLGINSSESVDANRALHCEYVRVPYEFGLIGTLLAGVALLGILGAAARLAASGDLRGYVLAAILPLLLLILAMENVIASSGMAAAMGLLLPVSHAVASLARRDPA